MDNTRVAMTPETARYLIDTAYYGACKHCGEYFSLRKDRKLRKHGKCPADYASAFHLRIDNQDIFIHPGDLAEIASAYQE